MYQYEDYRSVHASEKVCYDGGSVYVNFTEGVSRAGLSDARVKTDIDYESIPDILDDIKVASFRFTNKRNDDRLKVGVIAQDVIKLLSDNQIDGYSFIDTCKDGEDKDGIWYERDLYSVNYVQFIPLLIDKCQKLQKRANEQQNKINDLEERLARLEALIN